MLRFFSCSFLLLLCASQVHAAPRKLFLSIGINNYTPGEFHDLRFAQKDAQDIANALKEKFDGGIVLTGAQASDGRVTKEDVLSEFNKLAAENRDENDVILVYVSTHGTVGHRSDGRIEKYLVTSDSIAKRLDETAIAHAEIARRFNNLKSRRKVLIFDSCYSGAGKSRLSKNILDQLARSKGVFFKEPESDVSEGTVTLTASAWGEEAVESPELQNGVYTHFLMQGFDRDYNGDGAVSITEAHEFATQRVVQVTQGRQNPSARVEMVGQDPIIIRGERSSGKPLLFAYEWATRKLGIEINGKKMGDLSKGGLLVPDGLQRLVIFDEKGEVVVDRHIRFEKGAEYPLSQFLYEDPSWSLRLTGWNGKHLNERQAKRSFPSVIKGIQVELQKEDTIKGFDLQVRALVIPAFDATIQTDGADTKQNAKGGRLSLMLGKHHKGSRGMSVDWAGYMSEHLGLSMIHIERRIESSSFNSKKQLYSAPGLSASVEGGLESLSARVQIGLRLGVEAYYSPWSFGSAVQTFGTAELALGYIW